MEYVWLVMHKINLRTGSREERGILYASREACESTRASLAERESAKVWQTFARSYTLADKPPLKLWKAPRV